MTHALILVITTQYLLFFIFAGLAMRKGQGIGEGLWGKLGLVVGASIGLVLMASVFGIAWSIFS